jgi:hypothetical protein
MSIVHFELERAFTELQSTVNARVALDCAQKPVPPEEKVEAEFHVHLGARSLFTRYVDEELWGGLDTAERSRVYGALKQARSSVSVDKRCEASLDRQLKSFEHFVVSHGLELTSV